MVTYKKWRINRNRTKRRGNLLSLRKHYEVTTLSVIVRKEDLEVKQPLFTQLGRSLFEQRVESPELADTYKRIETNDKAVQEYE
jgi:hypothetical protein